MTIDTSFIQDAQSLQQAIRLHAERVDLREEDRTRICELASKVFLLGTEIWAYGSRVKGTNHDTSDLDLVVHFPSGQARGMIINSCLRL